MEADVVVATYRGIAAARAAVEALARAGIAGEAVVLVTRPQEGAGDAGFGTRDRLMQRGLPEHDAQIFADLVQGGDAVVLVTARQPGDALGRALAILGASGRDEPLATFRVEVDATPA